VDAKIARIERIVTGLIFILPATTHPPGAW
jgi:hypothetical protein